MLLKLHHLLQITQYSCDYNNLAPEGCTQYFWGETTGAFMSFNYNGKMMDATNNE